MFMKKKAKKAMSFEERRKAYLKRPQKRSLEVRNETSPVSVKYLVGIGVAGSLFFLWILWLTFLNEEDYAPRDLLLIRGGFVLLMFCTVWMAWLGILIRNDYVQVDSEGITIDAHSKHFFTKHYRACFRWEELSAYSIGITEVSTGGQQVRWVKISNKLKLYDVNGCLVGNFDFQHYMEDDLSRVEQIMSEYIKKVSD
jgi:hypothetical protein